MIQPGTTPEQLEEAAARMRMEQAGRNVQETPAIPRVRFRLFSAPIAEADALGEDVDAKLSEIQEAGERCAKPPGIWVDDGHVLVALVTAPGED